MTLYIGRKSSKLWKIICIETTTEINLLANNWKDLIARLVFQELGKDKAYMSETLFTLDVKIYTVLLWCSVLAFLVASQFPQMITFYSTQLPGPNYHCREKCLIGPAEENHKLLIRNAGDPADWMQRTQVNVKILDDGNAVHVNTTTNGA